MFVIHQFEVCWGNDSNAENAPDINRQNSPTAGKNREQFILQISVYSLYNKG